jgi:hypothetical protein
MGARSDTDLHEALDLSISQLLHEQYSDARFRAAFLGHPALKKWTVRDVLESADGLQAFLHDCRMLPQFGATQEIRLLAILMDLQAGCGAASTSIKEVRGTDEIASIEISGEFHPNFVLAWKAVYQRAWQRAHFDEFIYIPGSLPEFAKHPAVLRAEIGPDIDLSQYYAENASLRRSVAAMTSVKGLILMDRARLELIFTRRGPYAGLSDSVMTEQFSMLSELLDTIPSGIAIKVCDIAGSGLSIGSVVGDMVTLWTMGGYLVTQDIRLKAVIAQRSSKVAESCPSFSAYFSALDQREVAAGPGGTSSLYRLSEIERKDSGHGRRRKSGLAR